MTQPLEFTWTSTVDKTSFVCDTDLELGRNSCDEQIIELLRWVKTHLKPRDYEMSVVRTDTVTTREQLELEHGKLVCDGGTVFKPWRLRIDLAMPTGPAAVFATAFSARQRLEDAKPRASVPARRLSPFIN